MAVRETPRYCVRCGRTTRHEKHVLGPGWGCLLTVLTGGFFVLVWLVLLLVEALRRYYCSVCGAPAGAARRRCPACGSLLPARARYCRDCGAALTASPPPGSPPPPGGAAGA